MRSAIADAMSIILDAVDVPAQRVRGGPGVLPEQFGPYRLEELIGRGGMGEIYLAFDTVRQRTVAVKRLPAQLADDADFQSRFWRESQLAARRVIPIHDFGEIDGRLFIDMRLVTGADLAAVLAEQGPLLLPRGAVGLRQTQRPDYHGRPASPACVGPGAPHRLAGDQSGWSRCIWDELGGQPGRSRQEQ
jgi:hypothetical protein